MSDAVPPEDSGLARVRAGVMGAPVAPALQVIQGGRQAGPEDAPPPEEDGGEVVPPEPKRTAETACPLVPLGHADGEWHFLDAAGQKRALKSRALTSRGDLVGLFLGNTSWLFEFFPNKVTVKERDHEGNVTGEREEIRGFRVSPAGEYLMELCGAAGLFGSHVVLRGPGVWAGDDGAPVVHCGDVVLTGGAWKETGFRSGHQVWITAAPRPRPGLIAEGAPLAPEVPGFAAGPEVGQAVQRDIGELWQFRLPGSEIVCLGLMAVGYYGTAARWRPNGYLIGGTGSGKSMLLQLLRACVPHAEFSTDTSKAGLEQTIAGKPSPVYLDEAGDRQGTGAQLLLDVVLSATGGDGTRGLRGAADGGSRAFQVACSVIMAAVAPPQMGPQHRDRFTIVHLVKPGAGADNRDAMEAVTRRAKASAGLLWGRAVAGWPRFEAGLAAFREALARHGCAPREMDQAGAILAAWWVLTAEGVPDARAADDGVAAIAAFLRGADEIAEDDGPRRVVRFLASSLVQKDRSTDVEQVGVLVQRAFDNMGEAREGPQRLLERNGVRVIQEGDALTSNNKPIPRGDLGAGLWFSKSSEPLKKIFHGSPYEGERWAFELARLPGAIEWRRSVRVGGVSGPALWVPRAAWSPPEDEAAPPGD
jgi:hypothetical protein